MTERIFHPVLFGLSSIAFEPELLGVEGVGE
jgi:hypothetical protein